jgi:acetoin utilization protein AcuC
MGSPPRLFVTEGSNPPRNAVFLSAPELWSREHGGSHPLRAERLQRTHELLAAYGVFERSGVRLVAPPVATEDELALFHTREYISAVRRLSEGDTGVPHWRYGFGPGDNPVFPGMFESESLKVGSTLEGARLVTAGSCDVAFSYGGGLHHAGPAEASGFCTFNDAAVTLRWLVRQGVRPAYVDIDAHHADGVQAAFYESPDVLTVSLHQDGRTLFPGTGGVDEVGRGRGEGCSLNLPLPPGTDDELYLWAFDQVVPEAIGRFRPDLLVTQLGVDAHVLDPLADLALTTAGLTALVERLSGLAPRWLALGGGGYDIEVVPRAWALAFGVMAGIDLPDDLPPTYCARYGGEKLRDGAPTPAAGPARERLQETVEGTVALVRARHGLSAPGPG